MEFVFAYLDPGSGSLIIQAAIAGLIAVPVMFRNRIMRMVGRIRGSAPDRESIAEPTRPDSQAR
jgi:hypothetical protein